MDDITGFLYLIGSVFAPMIAVQIADHFILHRDRFAVAADARNLVIWLVGFIAYRLLMGVDTPVGYTLPDMVLTVVLCLLAEKVNLPSKCKKREGRAVNSKNSTLYFAKPVLFWSTGGSYNGSIISKKTR